MLEPVLGSGHSHTQSRNPSAVLTYPAGSADADDGDVGAPGMVQHLDELMQHDPDGRNAHAMLKAERNAEAQHTAPVNACGSPSKQRTLRPVHPRSTKSCTDEILRERTFT